jgi:hypothetical protein
MRLTGQARILDFVVVKQVVLLEKAGDAAPAVNFALERSLAFDIQRAAEQ